MKGVAKLLCLSLACVHLACAQATAPSNQLTKKQIRKSRSRTLGVGTAWGLYSFRDLAISPLTYKSYSMLPMMYGLEYRSKDANIEALLSAYYIGGEFTAKSVYSEIFTSNLEGLIIDYTRLYKLRHLTKRNWNTKLGFKVESASFFRSAKALQNAATGIDAMGTVYVSAKTEYIINAKSTAVKKIFYGRLDIGLINTTYRNGYSYITNKLPSESTEFAALLDYLDGYKYDVSFIAPGLRLGTEIGYEKTTRNKNAYKIAYVWDLRNSGGAYEQFQTYNHGIRFTLLFNTNNR